MWTHQNGTGSHSDVQPCLGRNSNGYFVENVPYINFASRVVPWRTVGHLYMECLSRVLFEEHLRALSLRKKKN